MKVKILRDLSIKKLECRVNRFIKDKCIINISHELARIKVCDRYVEYLIFIILYDEYNNCGYIDTISLKNLKNNEIN